MATFNLELSGNSGLRIESFLLTGPGTFDTVNVTNASAVQFYITDGTGFNVKEANTIGDPAPVTPGETGYTFGLKPLNSNINYPFLVEPQNAGKTLIGIAWK